MKTLAIIILSATLVLPINTATASNDCAIWLCLPFGFSPPGCGPAKRAMIRRLRRFKPPVPSFASCQVQNPTHNNRYTMETHNAVLMGPYRSGSLIIRPRKKIIDYGSCIRPESDHESPRGCIRTIKAVRVFQNGVQMGKTYYRDREGPDYVGDPVTGELVRADGTTFLPD